MLEDGSSGLAVPRVRTLSNAGLDDPRIDGTLGTPPKTFILHTPQNQQNTGPEQTELT